MMISTGGLGRMGSTSKSFIVSFSFVSVSWLSNVVLLLALRPELAAQSTNALDLRFNYRNYVAPGSGAYGPIEKGLHTKWKF